MSATAKPFTANIPHYAEDSNNGQPYLVADMIVLAIAYTMPDGSLKGVDVEGLYWKDHDVTNYVYQCQPETWERFKEAARAFYLTPANVTS